MTITPDALLCFYTDGLIERPGEPIDDSVARLCRAVTAQPPEAACAAVMAAPVGGEPARDDIALLMFWRQPPGRPKLAPPRSTNALWPWAAGWQDYQGVTEFEIDTQPRDRSAGKKARTDEGQTQTISLREHGSALPKSR